MEKVAEDSFEYRSLLEAIHKTEKASSLVAIAIDLEERAIEGISIQVRLLFENLDFLYSKDAKVISLSEVKSIKRELLDLAQYTASRKQSVNLLKARLTKHIKELEFCNTQLNKFIRQNQNGKVLDFMAAYNARSK